MTRIELKGNLLGADGEALSEDGKPVYVGDILKRCLLIPDGQKDDEKTSDEDKCRAWFLVMEINKAMKSEAASFEFEAGDVILMQKQLKRAYNSPLVVGQIKPLLK